jgi:tight adherence protein C
MPAILPIVIAGVAALAILLIFVGLAGSAPVDPVQARLTQLGTMQAKNLEELELQQPFIERTLRPLASRLSGAVARITSTSFTERTEKRLALAGHPGNLRVADWLGIKAIGALVTAGILFLFFGLIGGNILMGILLGVAGLGIGYILPEFWLSRRVKGRQKAILKMIPDALDLLTISVRAGLGFDGALGKVVEKLKGPLTEEFRRALAEIRVGKARRDALRDIVPRTEVPALTNFIGAIIQAEQLGVSISKVLQVQSEQLRIERRQRAEEMAAKAPIKMLFPLVGCIFPSLFIVILGPALILIALNLG